MRCHALLCLSNLIAGLDMQDLGGPYKVYTMWHDIITLAFEETGGKWFVIAHSSSLTLGMNI